MTSRHLLVLGERSPVFIIKNSFPKDLAVGAAVLKSLLRSVWGGGCFKVCCAGSEEEMG